MSSQGVLESDIRGGNSTRSEILRVTYDSSTTGHGPLSSKFLGDGWGSRIADVR